MSPHAATYDDALQAFLFMSAWWGGHVPVKLAGWSHAEDRDTIWRQGPSGDLAGIVRFLEDEYSDEVMLGVPQARPWNGGVSWASMLWAVVEGNDQLRRARAFHPRPSLVLQAGAGSRRWLIWPLEERAGYFDVQAMNRRIAYHLRATQRHGDADRAWFPAPGTCLRVGRARPVPVRVARLTADFYRLGDSRFQRLKEPPDRDAWLNGTVAR